MSEGKPCAAKAKRDGVEGFVIAGRRSLYAYVILLCEQRPPPHTIQQSILRLKSLIIRPQYVYISLVLF